MPPSGDVAIVIPAKNESDRIQATVKAAAGVPGADMIIAVFSERVRAGGHGFVVALSGSGIRRATGWLPAQPLNGQRCLTRAAFEAARPLAPGWGVETALSIDLYRIGM